MNQSYWHLVINHFPIIFPVAGVIVMITGLISNSDPVKRAAYLIFIIGSLCVFPTMETGEGAEEVVESVLGISEDYIETHEEAAESFAIYSYIFGVVSLFGLWVSFKRNQYSDKLSIVILIYACLVLYFAKEVGNTGGEIRHTEIRVESSLPVERDN